MRRGIIIRLDILQGSRTGAGPADYVGEKIVYDIEIASDFLLSAAFPTCLGLEYYLVWACLSWFRKRLVHALLGSVLGRKPRHCPVYWTGTDREVGYTRALHPENTVRFL